MKTPNNMDETPPFHLDQTFDYRFLNHRTRYVLYRILDPTTNNATGTTIGGDFVMPFGGTIEEVGATVDTAGTTGTLTVDINKNTNTIISTKITVDSAEKTSRTAATPYVLSVRGFNKGDIFTFDVDAVHTTPAKGITIFMRVFELTR